MKLYGALIRFFRVAGQLYFAEIHATGLGNLPRTGPVMLAANHPASILDAILLSSQAPRPVRYLARSGLFRWPLLAQLFRLLGAIPVYRRHEARDHADRNADMFRQLYELFEAGGCVGIFPEGQNSPRGRVGRLRTGAARIALGAEARNGYRLGLRIVPAGITFESRELLMSAVLLRFGAPVTVSDYAEQHQQDPEGAIEALTRNLQTALQRQTLHIEDRQVGDLATDLASILGDHLDHGSTDATDAETQAMATAALPKRWLWKLLGWYRRSSPETRRALDRRLQGRQRINEILTAAAEQEPQAVATLRNQLERYKDHLDQAKLRHALHQSLDQPIRERLLRMRMTAWAIAVAPVAIFGLVHNAVPYLLTRWAARLFRDESVRAFAGFIIGAAAFTTSYALFGTWLWQRTELSLPWTLAYLAALPPTGLVALGYRRGILVYRDRILLRTLFWNERELVELLRHERAMIIARFQALASRYPVGGSGDGSQPGRTADVDSGAAATD